MDDAELRSSSQPGDMCRRVAVCRVVGYRFFRARCHLHYHQECRTFTEVFVSLFLKNCNEVLSVSYGTEVIVNARCAVVCNNKDTVAEIPTVRFYCVVGICG